MPTPPQLIVPPQALQADCPASKPPTGAELINALSRYPQVKTVGVENMPEGELKQTTMERDAWEARFLLMQDHWMKQTDAVANCNVQFKAIRKWTADQKQLETLHETGGSPH